MAIAQKSTAREWIEALLIAGLFLGFTNTFVAKTFYIPSASMEDSLLVGDHLFVNRFIYGPALVAGERRFLPGRAIRRGDVVIFRSPEKPQQDMVKRCLGLPGDTIELVKKDLYINSQWVDDGSYTLHREPRVFSSSSSEPGRRRDNFGPYTVPAGHYFCMGDNRDNSWDSRFWGPVPQKFVKGRAFLIYWSYGGATPDGTWPGWARRLVQLARTVVGIPFRTRWSRTFHLVR